MIAIPIAFVLSLVIALALTPLVKRLGLTLGAVDRGGASSRKIHTGTRTRLGGIAIAAGFYGPLVGLLAVESVVGGQFGADRFKVLGLLGGGLAVVALGVYDDLRGANAPKKFLVQFAVAIALYALGFRIDAFSTPFGTALNLGWFGPLVSVLWVVGIINAMNLIDGLDGLASGVAFFAAGTTLVIAAVNGNTMMMLFMAALTGAILGFLVFNFNPASIFMGDSGSMFLGYVIAVTSVQTNTKGPATVALLAPVLALGLPIMDTFLAMGRRLLRGQSMFQADREHIHHRLVSLGLSHRTAVLLLYGLSLFLGAGAVAVTVSNGPATALVLGATVVVVIVFMRRLGYLSLRQTADNGETLADLRRRNLTVRRIGREIGSHSRQAKSTEALWESIVSIREPLGSCTMRLQISSDEGVDASARGYESGSKPSVGEPTFSWRQDLEIGDRPYGFLELTWADGRTALSRDDEIALGILTDYVSTALERLQRDNSHG